jgi:formamidopyrimidine-DNA glycosylase
MPELPDVVVYVEHLRRRTTGRILHDVHVLNPFVLRTATPPLATIRGRKVEEVRRLGKRIVIGLEGGLFLVLHLMIAGRLRWTENAARAPGRNALAVFQFDNGRLVLTEAGSKRRAAVHILEGRSAVERLDRGGLEVLQADRAAFAERLRSENHHAKRALTAPQLFSGIGNAYSDEILHRARLSPLALTQSLDDGQIDRLYEAARAVLQEWTERLREQAGEDFPQKVTAFREGMAVHGRYRQPCPVCGHAGTAYRVRRKRGELLRALSDRRPPARRSRPVPAVEEELAEIHR